MGEGKNHEDQIFKGYTRGGTRKGLAEEKKIGQIGGTHREVLKTENIKNHLRPRDKNLDFESQKPKGHTTGMQKNRREEQRENR